MRSHYLVFWINISSKQEIPFLKACIVSVIVWIHVKTQFLSVFVYFLMLFFMYILETHRLKWFLEGLLSIQVSDLYVDVLTKRHKGIKKPKKAKSKKKMFGYLPQVLLFFFFLMSYVLCYLLLTIFLCIRFHSLNLPHLWLSLLKNFTSTSSCICCLISVKLHLVSMSCFREGN